MLLLVGVFLANFLCGLFEGEQRHLIVAPGLGLGRDTIELCNPCGAVRQVFRRAWRHVLHLTFADRFKARNSFVRDCDCLPDRHQRGPQRVRVVHWLGFDLLADRLDEVTGAVRERTVAFLEQNAVRFRFG